LPVIVESDVIVIAAHGADLRWLLTVTLVRDDQTRPRPQRPAAVVDYQRRPHKVEPRATVFG
jgi:hypothetical protein